MEIDKAKGYRELVEHGTPSFPMQIYKNEFRWYVGHLIGWHWHPELELSVVLSGEVDIFINNMSNAFAVCAGRLRRIPGGGDDMLPAVIHR